MSSSAPDSRATQELEITGGAAISISLPSGARDAPESELPLVTLPASAGVRVALRRAYDSDGGARLYAFCAAAPSDRWAPGVEALVLERANAMAQGALRGEIERFDVREIDTRDARFEQRFDGVVHRREHTIRFAGRHLLGFAGQAKEAVLCTVLCESKENDARCEALTAEVSAVGAWTEAPPPSLLVRSILLAADHPHAALGVVAALSLAAFTIVLSRRPKPGR